MHITAITRRDRHVKTKLTPSRPLLENRCHRPYFWLDCNLDIAHDAHADLSNPIGIFRRSVSHPTWLDIELLLFGLSPHADSIRIARRSSGYENYCGPRIHRIRIRHLGNGPIHSPIYDVHRQFLSGLGCGTFFGIAYTVTNVYVPAHRRSLATALVNSGTAVGSGIGLASSSLLVSTGALRWQSLTVAAGSFALIMAFVYARIMPGQNSAESPTALERKLNNLANETARSSFFKPPMIAAYILYFSTLYLYYLISTWLPNYLGSVRGFEASLTGLVSSIVFFAGVPGALLFSKLADRFPARKYHFVIALEALAVCALMSTLAAKTNEEIIAGIALYGFFGKLAVEPIIISWLNGFISPWNTATALGTLNFFGMSASVIAPFVTGALADTTGQGDLGFYVAAVVTLLGTIVFGTVAAPYKKGLH